jgi:hypothetical protein
MCKIVLFYDIHCVLVNYKIVLEAGLGFCLQWPWPLCPLDKAALNIAINTLLFEILDVSSLM